MLTVITAVAEHKESFAITQAPTEKPDSSQDCDSFSANPPKREQILCM